MAQLPRWQLCWSESNLTSFLYWFKHLASEDEQADALFLPMLIHYGGPFAGIAEHVPVTLEFRGVVHEMREEMCRERDCERCSMGRGGWQFRWTDPRWTPQASLHLTLDPLSQMEESSKPWPLGCHGAPKAAVPPPPASD